MSEVVDLEIGLVVSRGVAISICDVVASTERRASVARHETTPVTTSTLRRYVGVVRDAQDGKGAQQQHG